jgi:hypothetical protein
MAADPKRCWRTTIFHGVIAVLWAGRLLKGFLKRENNGWYFSLDALL